jgi:hypothetical protein
MAKVALEQKRAILRFAGASWTNSSQFRKGRERGHNDYENGREFGATCNHLTRSFCAGYVIGWRFNKTRWNVVYNRRFT